MTESKYEIEPATTGLRSEGKPHESQLNSNSRLFLMTIVRISSEPPEFIISGILIGPFQKQSSRFFHEFGLLWAEQARFIWGFPKIRGTFLGVPVLRTIYLGGLCWGLPILGNSQG